MQNKFEYLKSLKPISDRLIVLPDEQEKETATGIITSGTKQGEDKRVTGVVMAIGKGRYSEHGVLLPMESKVGDRVLFSKYVGDDFLIDEELNIEKYDGVCREDQTLVCSVRQDSLVATLPKSDV